MAEGIESLGRLEGAMRATGRLAGAEAGRVPDQHAILAVIASGAAGAAELRPAGPLMLRYLDRAIDAAARLDRLGQRVATTGWFDVRWPRAVVPHFLAAFEARCGALTDEQRALASAQAGFPEIAMPLARRYAGWWARAQARPPYWQPWAERAEDGRIQLVFQPWGNPEGR